MSGRPELSRELDSKLMIFASCKLGEKKFA